MPFVCHRCEHVTKHAPYRVTTKDRGIVLLNMLVCLSCAQLAKRLGLPVIKVKMAKRTARRKNLRAMADKKLQRVRLTTSIR
jgi:hypothetical protein